MKSLNYNPNVDFESSLKIEHIKNILSAEGLVKFDLREFPNLNLLEVATLFGIVIPGARGEMIQILPARDKGNGPVGSFSYVVGFDAFPWHTDTAYWSRPTRYLLLTSPEASSCATLYQGFDTIKANVVDFDYLISRAVFMMNVPGKRRYLSPRFEDDNGLRGFRLDYHIYCPMNEEAVLLLGKVGIFLKQNHKRLIWTGTNAVIIDNWKYIHAREDAYNDKNRILKRIYINELV